jgi:hypothetical protein
MSNRKPISVKVTRESLIDALRNALADRKERLKKGKADQEAHDKAVEAWQKAITAFIKTGKAKVTLVTHSAGWRNEQESVSVTMEIPASLPFPKAPDADNSWTLGTEIEELENAIAILQMSAEEYVNASTYNGVARLIK